MSFVPVVVRLKEKIMITLEQGLGLTAADMQGCQVTLSTESHFGDMSSNAPLVLARRLKRSPQSIGEQCKELLTTSSDPLLQQSLADVELAGAGFLNMYLQPVWWRQSVGELLQQGDSYFVSVPAKNVKKFLIEFVSANPTGPLHLGAGRNGIIGDVLGNVLRFVGHRVHKEYYINDAGSQIGLLGQSLKARCMQALGQHVDIPEGGYNGIYLIDLAQECIEAHGPQVIQRDDTFFKLYAVKMMLQAIKNDLRDYGIIMDEWFSEQSLYDNELVERALELLEQRDAVYEKDGALWFKATEFGDDKDRVLRKQNSEMTYIASDIAYHKNKFDRGFDHLITILGQDHHGYVKRLKAVITSLGYDADCLDIILYQLVTIKHGEEVVKMSKRAGTFTTLRELIDTVGRDVTRFFYLNKKADAHLEFDLEVALKKTHENPVFYLQYAYVRTKSVLEKAAEIEQLTPYVKLLQQYSTNGLPQDLVKAILQHTAMFEEAEREVVKKIVGLYDLLEGISSSYQIHLLAHYAWDLANLFHVYYTKNRIINEQDIPLTQGRLLLVMLVRNALSVCLRLLGVSRPEVM